MGANTGTETTILTPEELLRRASDMVPVLKSRGARTEELRRIPSETVQDILSSGLYRIGVPARFGGLDVDYGLVLEVGAELGRGCGASSWCYSLWSAHACLVGTGRRSSRAIQIHDRYGRPEHLAGRALG